MKWLTLTTVHCRCYTARVAERRAASSAILEQLVPAAIHFTLIFILSALRCYPAVYCAVGLFLWQMKSRDC